MPPLDNLELLQDGQPTRLVQWGEVRAGEAGVVTIELRNPTVWLARAIRVEAMDPRVSFSGVPQIIPPGESRELQAVWRPLMGGAGLSTPIRIRGEFPKGPV